MRRKPRKRLLSLADVAEILNVSQGTVRNLLKTGALPEPKTVFGRVKRWFPSDIALYLARLRVSEVDKPPGR